MPNGFAAGYVSRAPDGFAREAQFMDTLRRISAQRKSHEQAQAAKMQQMMGMVPDYMAGDPMAQAGLAALGMPGVRAPMTQDEQAQAQQEQELERMRVNKGIEAQTAMTKQRQEDLALRNKQFQASLKWRKEQEKQRELEKTERAGERMEKEERVAFEWGAKQTEEEEERAAGAAQQLRVLTDMGIPVSQEDKARLKDLPGVMQRDFVSRLVQAGKMKKQKEQAALLRNYQGLIAAYNKGVEADPAHPPTRRVKEIRAAERKLTGQGFDLRDLLGQQVGAYGALRQKQEMQREVKEQRARAEAIEQEWGLKPGTLAPKGVKEKKVPKGKLSVRGLGIVQRYKNLTDPDERARDMQAILAGAEEDEDIKAALELITSKGW